MRISFTATQTGFEADVFAIVCGVTGVDSQNQEHFLTFQRDAEASDNDWGIYLEFDDQINGDYNCVGKCLVERELVKVDLIKQLGNLQNISGFNVMLEINEKSFNKLSDFLKLIFRDRLNDLEFVT